MSAEIGGRIKAILNEKGMTQRELADKTGVTEISISRYVSGKRMPKIATIMEIAKSLGVSAEYLIEEERLQDTHEENITFTNKELKPCPFCGGDGSIQQHIIWGYADTFGIVCLECGCGIMQSYTNKRTAIRAWNRRVNDDEQN